jgi:poly(hydroxyalkanoate) granule-associated protein
MSENADASGKMPETETQNGGPVKNTAVLVRTMMLAGIGAVAFAKDEGKAVVTRLVQRGAEVESKARRRLESLGTRSKEQSEQAQVKLEKQVENVLVRMNIPTKDDIASLSTSVSVLSAKIDALLARPAPEGPEN